MQFTKDNAVNQLSVEVVKYVYEQYSKLVEKYGFFTLVLSGGNTPKYIFDELAKNYSEKIDWKKIHVFWLDERCVPVEHIDNNYKLAYDHLLKHIQVSSIHRMKGELDPVIAAKLYEEEIRAFFSLDKDEVPEFDLILLGMGEDGHCASLFPESKEINETERLVVSTEKQYNGHKRISLTLPVINKSKKVLMIGSQDKVDVYKNKAKYLPIHMVSSENMKVIVKI